MKGFPIWYRPLIELYQNVNWQVYNDLRQGKAPLIELYQNVNIEITDKKIVEQVAL